VSNFRFNLYRTLVVSSPTSTNEDAMAHQNEILKIIEQAAREGCTELALIDHELTKVCGS